MYQKWKNHWSLFLLLEVSPSSPVTPMYLSWCSVHYCIGGDGPEAVTAGMKAALDLQWRPQASKMAVLIADAPPHGIGE